MEAVNTRTMLACYCVVPPQGSETILDLIKILQLKRITVLFISEDSLLLIT